mmetsp:Transcript_103399/g.299072  ORF Transcript_103399/g.299072 Transcript_103399/m.299072 type:complete len:424 (+) Transcript_103399:3080-4351(+)
MVDVRLQAHQHLCACLVPQREEAQHGELRLRIGVGIVLTDLCLEPLVLQQKPHTSQIPIGTLHRVHIDALLLHVNRHLQGGEVLQWAIFHSGELRVHQAQPSWRVLLQHLIEHLSEASSADLHLALRDRVLDRGDEDVLGVLDGSALRARDLQNLDRARLLHNAQEYAVVLQVPKKGDQHNADVQDDAHQRHPHESALALLRLGERQQLCGAGLADVPSAVGLGLVGVDKDGDVRGPGVVVDRQARGASKGGHRQHRCPLGVQQVNPTCRRRHLLVKRGWRQAEGPLVGGRIGRHVQDHKHRRSNRGRGVVAQLPVRHVARVRAAGLHRHQAGERRAGLADPRQRPAQLVHLVTPIDDRLLAPMWRRRGRHSPIDHRGLLDRRHRRAQHPWPVREHVLTLEAVLRASLARRLQVRRHIGVDRR